MRTVGGKAILPSHPRQRIQVQSSERLPKTTKKEEQTRSKIWAFYSQNELPTLFLYLCVETLKGYMWKLIIHRLWNIGYRYSHYQKWDELAITLNLQWGEKTSITVRTPYYTCNLVKIYRNRVILLDWHFLSLTLMGQILVLKSCRKPIYFLGNNLSSLWVLAIEYHIL